VDRLHLGQRDALVDALQLGEIGFGERERRCLAQARPSVSIEVEIARRQAYFLK
jgi:hypothetical protein